MKLAERLKAGPTVSFELFPGHDEKSSENLRKVAPQLAALCPDFVSVTFGAGGTTRQGSFELARYLKQELQLEVLPYFACYGLGFAEINAVVDRYCDLGLESLLAVRGDPPADDEGYTVHLESLPHASDLIAFLKTQHPALCLGAAGYPEGHVAAASQEQDLDYLALKIQNGAEFVIANFCYDNERYFDFVARARQRGLKVPILPGVMPIYTVKMTENLARVCGATITTAVREGLASVPPDDKDALLAFGIRFATEQCRGLLKGGAPGVHIYTMDRAKAAVAIVNALREEGLL